jgi:hypothetical protein
MRMVSNKHVTSTSVKRFKKVHVLHKAYVAKPIETAVEKIEPVIEKNEPVIIEAPAVKVEEEHTEVFAAPVPKRKKRVTEPFENNEEKPEDNG